MISEKQEVYVIRYVGCPSNPRFKINKSRTAKVSGSEADARRYVDSLVRGQGVRVLSIRRVLLEQS